MAAHPLSAPAMLKTLITVFTSHHCVGILGASPGGINWMGASFAIVLSKVSKAEDHVQVSNSREAGCA